MDYNKKSLIEHEKHAGKLEIKSKFPLSTRDDLSTAYTPGVAAVSKIVAEDKTHANAYKYTIKRNSVAVVSDGSAVLGLGNIGPYGALPVMEGKSILFKEFGHIDAYPICLDTQDTEEIINAVKLIAPGFAGINLEDISAPRCFEIESRLQNLGIPVFHDDQDGTAVTVLAALMNACKVADKDLSKIRVVINGAGAAAIAVTRMLLYQGVSHIILVDTKGIIHTGRAHLNHIKEEMTKHTNKACIKGTLADAMIGSDVFIGVSVANVVTEDIVRSMSKDPIIFAMANPTPEIMPDIAKKAGALIVGTGRSDFPNQINNVLAFPGIFRGAIDAKAVRITTGMKLAAAHALADSINPKADAILPSPLDRSIAGKVAEAVRKKAIEECVVRKE